MNLTVKPEICGKHINKQNNTKNAWQTLQQIYMKHKNKYENEMNELMFRFCILLSWLKFKVDILKNVKGNSAK